MKRFQLFLITIILLIKCFNFKSQVILSLGKSNVSNMVDNIFDNPCVEKVRVVDNRPSKCTYDNLVWYPVIYEDFNSNYVIEELLNNYSFRYENADNEDG